MNELHIEYHNPKDLKPYDNNAREHNEEDIDAIRASIQEFGFNDPIGIWSDDNLIVEGHGRQLAAIAEGLSEVPCIRLDHLTDEQRRAYALAHNKTAELSQWDFMSLDMELAGIEEIDMTAFGFMPVQELEPKVVEDEVPEEVETKCKVGDLWQLGGHRLICGDSTDVNVIDKLMDGAKADMVFTDPPYGMGLNTNFSDMRSRLNTDIGDRQMKGTNYPAGKVDEFSEDMIQSIFSINAPETFMWGADYYAETIPNRNDGSWFVWDKRTDENEIIENDDVALDRGYGSCFELCYSKKKHKRLIARVKWSGLFGMEKEFDNKRVHPTQKPTALAGWFITRYSKAEDNIIDIFGGSGSTLIACEQLNRRCYMCELDPHYCDVIIQRWENLTGQQAELIS